MAAERSVLEARLAADVAAALPEEPARHSGLTMYLPHCVLEQLAQPETAPRRPSLDRFDGVVLFTDLAAFSRLTDELSARGPEGVEQLSNLLNSYFGRMTEIALEHGGDVVDFVGDAIVVMWPGAGRLAEAAAEAVHCGLALQLALREVMSTTGLPLRQRVSISAGELTQFVVGGVDGKWRWLIAGEPMRQAGACNHQAQPGEVLVCEPAWQLVRERCQGRLLPAGHALADRIAPLPQAPRRRRPPPQLVPAARIEEFVAQPLLDRFRAGHWGWLGEFRNVSAVFVGFPDLDASSPAALADVQYAAECAQHEFARYGGSLETLSMDDKGVTALAAFGLPARMHEDNSVRAVRAAMSLAAKLQARGLRCSTGIAHGRAFYGDSGGLSRRHVALVGGVVNLAARLMQAADGGILCDEPTRRSAGDALGFLPRAPLQVKGQSQAVAVYTPGDAGAAGPSPQENSIIGRSPERQRIEQSLDTLLDGSGGLLLLRGEAGIGKSRLLREAMQQAQRRGVLALSGYGSSIESATPYFAWGRILHQLLLGEAPFDAAAAREELQRRLHGEELAETWTPLLNDILPLHYPDNAITRQMEVGARASSVRSLLILLLRGFAAEQPTLLAIDDLHWCDEASAGILAAVVEAVPQLLVLAATRPLDRSAAATVDKLLRGAEAQTLSLEQLPREELDLLACQKLGVRSLPAEVGDFVFARGGGNPFYSEELLLALSGARLLSVDGGVCSLGPDFANSGLATMPTTLHGVIISRVDQLAPAEQLTLKLVSVIGRDFSLQMLRELHPIAGDAAGLEAIVEALLATDILRPAAGAQRAYAFKHAILREVIYDLLPYAQRRQFHRDVALWVERNEASHLEPYLVELAMHWERAGEIPKALGYLERAGTLAFDRFANRQAIQHVRRAYALAQQHGLQLQPGSIEVCEGILGDSHQELFEYDAASRHFKRCLTQLGLPPSETRTGLVLGLLRQILLQLRLRLQRAGAPPPAAGNLAVRRAAHIYQRLAESSFFDNRPLELLYQIMASVNLAERSGATREIVDGFGAIAVVAVAAGLRRAGRYYNRRAMEIIRSAINPVDAAYGYLVDMVYWATIGGWARQEQSGVQAGAIYHQLGGTVRWQQTMSMRYTPLIAQGRYSEAEAVLQRARAAMSQDVPSQVLSFYYCSMIDLALARPAPLEPLIAALQAAQGHDLHRSDRIRSLGLIAQAWMRLGQPAQALAAADAALHIMRQSEPTPWHVTDGLAALAEVYMRAWDEAAPDAAPALRHKAAEVCKALLGFARRVPVGFPSAALQYARYHWRCGQRRSARRWWRRAMAAAQRLGTAHVQGLALYDMGTRLAPRDGGGLPALQQAQAIFERIGAEHDRTRVARALAAMSASTPA
jgi:adenylate cyclase